MSTSDPVSGAYAVGPPEPDLTEGEGPAPARPLGEIVKDLTSDFSTLIRQEMELAKAEVREEARKTGKAGAMLAAAAVVGLVGLIIFAMTLGFAFAIPFGVDSGFAIGFLITTILLLIVAAVAGSSGRKKLQEVNPKPEQTIETVREDARYLKEQAR